MPYSSKSIINEISFELKDCPLIYTDGITWCFLENLEEIHNIEDIVRNKGICLVEKGKRYRNGNYYTYSKNVSKNFEAIKGRIYNFVNDAVKKTKENN